MAEKLPTGPRTQAAPERARAQAHAVVDAGRR